MSPTKLLQINPTLFSVNSNGNNKSFKKKAIKPEMKDTKINPNRKALLAKIKDFQKKERENKQSLKKNIPNSDETTNEDIQDFEGEFNKSLNFLQELSNKHTLKKRDKKNKTLKKPIDAGNNINLELPQELKETEINIQIPENQPIKMQHNQPIKQTEQSIVSTTIPPNTIVPPAIEDIQKPLIQKPHIQESNHTSINLTPIQPISQQNIQIQSTPLLPQVTMSPLVISKPPPYSNLKGSLKPTYREWLQKTQKNYKQKNDNITFSDKNQISEISLNLSSKTNEIKNQQQNINQYRSKTNKSNTILKKIPIEKINKKTRTLKYSLGKKGNKIGVLIKNSNTRKKIRDDFLKLKKKNISEIKDVLRNRNLIKSGTLAPNDVLREIYEQSILTGDVVNKNKDALIHNYFSDK